MTYYEAHQYLELMLSEATKNRYAFSVELIDALGKAVEATELQLAKKPLRVNCRERIDDGNFMRVCPTCGVKLMERFTDKDMSYPRIYNSTCRCKCGQALDWSDQ